jgi:hypothetical protein
MSPAEELKHLITTRKLFSRQLTINGIDEKTKRQLHEIIGFITGRISLLMEVINSADAELKEFKIQRLQENRSTWFNDLSKTILRLLIAKEVTARIDLVKILSEFWSF